MVIDVLANDVAVDAPLDPSSVVVWKSPANGTVTNIDAATGQITYEPNTDFTGTDTFWYTVLDTNGLQSNSASVTVTVGACPAAEPIDGSLPDGYVQSITPSSGTVDPPSSIIITFNQPMDGALSNVAAPGQYSVYQAGNPGSNITISPPVIYDAGTYQVTLTVNPAEFDRDVEYTIEVKASMVNACGIEQGGAVTATFWTTPE